jgi:hypothetical protein
MVRFGRLSSDTGLKLSRTLGEIFCAILFGGRGRARTLGPIKTAMGD